MLRIVLVCLEDLGAIIFTAALFIVKNVQQPNYSALEKWLNKMKARVHVQTLQHHLSAHGEILMMAKYLFYNVSRK